MSTFLSRMTATGRNAFYGLDGEHCKLCPRCRNKIHLNLFSLEETINTPAVRNNEDRSSDPSNDFSNSTLPKLPEEVVLQIYEHATGDLANSIHLRANALPCPRYKIVFFRDCKTGTSLTRSLNDLGATRKLLNIAYETFFEQVTGLCEITGGKPRNDFIAPVPLYFYGPLVKSELFREYGRYLRLEVEFLWISGLAELIRSIKEAIQACQELREFEIVPSHTFGQAMWARFDAEMARVGEEIGAVQQGEAVGEGVRVFRMERVGA